MHDLSDRLINILVYLSNGKRTSEIAALVHFSERTVKRDITKLLEVFGASSRRALVAKARREGVIE